MFRIIAAAALLAALYGSALAQEPESEELQFLILEALSNNPEILAEISNMEAMEARVGIAGTLDDPELTFMKEEFPSFSPGTAMVTSLELMQMIRFPTKLGVESSIARVQAEHAHHEHLDKVVAVISRLKSAVASLQFARTALAINREDQVILDQIATMTERRYSVGKALQSDVLRSRMALATARALESTRQQMVIEEESMLRALLNRPGDAMIGPIEQDSLRPVAVGPKAILAFAQANKPMLVHDSLSVLESSLMTSMANQEYLPDFRFSLEYMRTQSGMPAQWSLRAGISLPIMPWVLGKASSRVEEARAMEARSRHRFRSSRSMMESSVRSAYARQVSGYRIALTHEKELLPQARRSFETALTEYQTGMAEYLMLLESFRMYQDIRLEAAMARMNYQQAVADLEQQAGVLDLTVIPALPSEDQP